MEPRPAGSFLDRSPHGQPGGECTDAPTNGPARSARSWSDLTARRRPRGGAAARERLAGRLPETRASSLPCRWPAASQKSSHARCKPRAPRREPARGGAAPGAPPEAEATRSSDLETPPHRKRGPESCSRRIRRDNRWTGACLQPQAQLPLAGSAVALFNSTPALLHAPGPQTTTSRQKRLTLAHTPPFTASRANTSSPDRLRPLVLELESLQVPHPHLLL